METGPDVSGVPAGRVIVGIDPLLRSTDLPAAAVAEAERRHRALAVIVVVRAAAYANLDRQDLDAEDARAVEAAQRALDDVLAAVRRWSPGLDVSAHVIRERDVGARPDPLDSADVLVVGSEGRYGRRAFGLETVSRILLRAARCPVLVVPLGGAQTGRQDPVVRPVVVASVSEHPSDAVVVQAACDEAMRRGADLDVLHAYQRHPTQTLEQAVQDAVAVAGRAVTGLPSHSDLRLSVLLMQESPEEALTRSAGGADLVVMGSRIGSLAGVIRGSVTRVMVDQPPCPLLVLPRGLPPPPLPAPEVGSRQEA